MASDGSTADVLYIGVGAAMAVYEEAAGVARYMGMGVGAAARDGSTGDVLYIGVGVGAAV